LFEVETIKICKKTLSFVECAQKKQQVNVKNSKNDENESKVLYKN